MADIDSRSVISSCWYDHLPSALPNSLSPVCLMRSSTYWSGSNNYQAPHSWGFLFV